MVFNNKIQMFPSNIVAGMFSFKAAEFFEIEEGEDSGTQKITLSIPKSAISDPDMIEEVVVIGRKPEEPEPLDISYEWLDDYDNDSYGLVIRLGKD